MEPDYAYGTQATPERVPELGRLKAAAVRIARACNNIDNFLTRFHGPGPSADASDSVKPPSTYRNDLDTLLSQIDQLEGVVSLLEKIG